MFSKTKEAEAGLAPRQPQLQTPSPLQPSAKQRTGRTNGVPSIISAEVIVTGTVISSGDIQVDGRINGDIRAGAIIVGEKAAIVGDIYADEAIIRGHVEGSIHARKVQLCATCHVEGNIMHEALSVEAGAFFEGNCRHSDNPLADAPENPPARPLSEHRKSSVTPSPAVIAKTSGDEAHAGRQAANFAPLKN